MIVQTEMDLAKLHFDPQNPRLSKAIRSDYSEENVLNYMIRSGNVVELMQSIGEMGFSEAEPLLVAPREGDSGNYVVVEGNRRLAALKLLSSTKIAKIRKLTIEETIKNAKHKPQRVPVLIYDNRNQILDYLGYRHITGVKDWGALEKARYLRQLYDKHIETEKEERIYSVLAKMIGSKSDYVARLLLSLKLYDTANEEAFFGIDIDEDNFNFSFIPTMLSYSNMTHYLGLKDSGKLDISTLNKDNLERVFGWVFHPDNALIQDSRQISDLNQIIGSEAACRRLEEGATISEAIIFTRVPSNTFVELLDKAKNSLQTAKDMIEQLSDRPEYSDKKIEDIEKLCRTLRGALSENFGVSDTTAKGELTPEQVARLLELLKQGESHDGAKG